MPFVVSCNLAGPKSPENAYRLREIGNIFYKKKNFFKALENYNLSLCCSKVISEEASLAYWNRSAVYLELKEYQACLDNIQLARESGCSLLERMDDREQRCLQLIESMKSPAASSTDFLKLSYPENPKIPFIVDCLELQINEKFGRHIVTTQDLKTGDIIAIEKPLLKSPEENTIPWRCANCLKSNKMSLIPTDIDFSAMFCSVKCREFAAKVFYETQSKCNIRDFTLRAFSESLHTCNGDFEKLRELMKQRDESKTVFDIDFTDKCNPLLKYQQLQVFHSLKLGPMERESKEFIENHPVLDLLDTEEDKNVAVSYMKRVYKIFKFNSMGIDWNAPSKPKAQELLNFIDIGSATLLFGSLLNHSCNSNIDRINFDDKILFFVRRPILKGEQLFTTYGPHHGLSNLKERKIFLEERYGFQCSCDQCDENSENKQFHINDWIAMRDAVIFEVSTITDYVQEFRKNCLAIQTSGFDINSLQMEKMMLKNSFLVPLIAKSEPFKF